MSVTLQFGAGSIIVWTGERDGRPAVLLYEAPQQGEVGAKAADTGLPDLAPFALTFPTKEQAQRVADALVTA